MTRRLLMIAVPVLILVLASFGTYTLWASKPEPVRRPAPEKTWVVETMNVRFGDETPALKLFGEVVAGRKVDLRPLVAGRIVDVGENFLEGGVVRKGDLLVAIDPFDYEADVAEREAERDEAKARLDEISVEIKGVRAQLKHDEAQLSIRRRDVARRKKLRGSGASSIKSLDDARIALIDNEQRLTDRKSAVATWSAKRMQQEAKIAGFEVAVRRAQRDLEETRLVAPFDGFLLNVEAEVGKRIGTGDRVANLIDAGRLEVRFHVSNATFARLRANQGYVGRVAQVRWQGDETGSPFEAVLEREGSEIETASGGVNLFARLRNLGPETAIRPGAFVRIEVPGQTYRGVVRLPERSVDEGNTVYVVKEDRLSARKTEVLARYGTDILVRGGIKNGERVLVTRLTEVGTGVRVTSP
jgi:multidrug efflux pump subunit AcrA (membrane-fusion protein)